jgi:hypothetical protein
LNCFRGHRVSDTNIEASLPLRKLYNKKVRYSDFEYILSTPRLRRYLFATGNTRRAVTLYRKNILLSQKLFAVVSCFEVALRNKIDRHYLECHGNDWIVKSVDGMFSDGNPNVQKKIEEKVKMLGRAYSHDKLVAEMEFGFWRYLFAPAQFKAAGSSLLKIFPGKPKSNILIQYNHTYVFEALQKINKLRNRIAHHESICFGKATSTVDTRYVRERYTLILQLFQWMSIDEKSLMHGLDHVLLVCNDIDSFILKATSPSSPSQSPYSFPPSAAHH